MIDMSGISGLGDSAMQAFNDILGQGRYDREMVLKNRMLAAEQANNAAQNQIRQQIAQQEQQQAEEQKASQRQGKIMQLAQVSKDGESFEKVAQYLLPDLTPLERDFGRTFADETSRVKREEKKAAEEAKEQATNRGFLQQGALDSFLAVPPDRRADAIAAAAPTYGLDPSVMGAAVQGIEARQARKAAEKAADEARKDARAAMKAGGAGGLNPNQQALQADRLRRTIRLEGAKWEEPMQQAAGALRAQEGVTAGDTEAQRLADAAMIRGYARILNPVGVLSDQDVAGTLAQLPGALGSSQTINRVLSGSGILTPGERKSMRKSLEGRMAAIGDKQRKTRAYAEKQAKKFGLDPADIVDPEGFGDVVTGKGTTTSAPAAPAPPSEAEYRKARVRARKFLERDPTEQEIMEMLKLKLGQ
jgi:hypothetical protein